MSIYREVPGNETEVGMGAIISTPHHWVVAWGEYAPEGEADGEVRVIAAIDEDGNDISEKIARLVADAIDLAIEEGVI